MTTQLRVIGVDPGPVPGIVMLDYDDGRVTRAEAIQCTHTIAIDLVTGLLMDAVGTRCIPAIVAVESFVVSRRSGRTSTPGASAVTRDVIGQLQRAVGLASVGGTETPLVQNNASRVKHWATDDRLKHVQVPGPTAGKNGQSLLDLTVGMRHARDAARHALFAASSTAGLPDPLSKTSRD